MVEEEERSDTRSKSRDSKLVGLLDKTDVAHAEAGGRYDGRGCGARRSLDLRRKTGRGGGQIQTDKDRRFGTRPTILGTVGRNSGHWRSKPRQGLRDQRWMR